MKASVSSVTELVEWHFRYLDWFTGVVTLSLWNIENPCDRILYRVGGCLGWIVGGVTWLI